METQMDIQLEEPVARIHDTSSMTAPTTDDNPLPTTQDVETLLSSYPTSNHSLLALFQSLITSVSSLRTANTLLSRKIELFTVLSSQEEQQHHQPVLTNAILEKLNLLSEENEKLFERLGSSDLSVQQLVLDLQERESALKDSHEVISQQENEINRLYEVLKTGKNGESHEDDDTHSHSRSSHQRHHSRHKSKTSIDETASPGPTSSSKHSESRRSHRESRLDDVISTDKRPESVEEDTEEKTRSKGSTSRSSRRDSDKRDKHRSSRSSRSHKDTHEGESERSRRRSRSPGRERKHESEGRSDRDRRHRSKKEESRSRSRSPRRRNEESAAKASREDDQMDEELEPPTPRTYDTIPTQPRHHRKSSDARNPNMLGRMGLPVSQTDGQSRSGLSILGRGTDGKRK